MLRKGPINQQVTLVKTLLIIKRVIHKALQNGQNLPAFSNCIKYYTKFLSENQIKYTFFYSKLGEEELQLQLALAMSREEAEQEESKSKSDDMRLQLALQKSKEEVAAEAAAAAAV